ncbi:MAG: helix-turn-helix domain-containing protein [Proteobacteria bacterium]|nr:helix-turn-helix domain-containing protein [Pseudomonadota bacterium]
MSGETGEQRRGIGARLRSAREKKGLTILQAAEKMHVDARVPECLESEDFAALGAPVFVRGHLRRYADLVGESPAQLLELYAALAPAQGPDLTRIPRAPPGNESSPLALPALLVAIGLALAGVLWWALTLPRARPQAVPQLVQPAPSHPAAAPAGRPQ